MNGPSSSPPLRRKLSHSIKSSIGLLRIRASISLLRSKRSIRRASLRSKTSIANLRSRVRRASKKKSKSSASGSTTDLSSHPLRKVLGTTVVAGPNGGKQPPPPRPARQTPLLWEKPSRSKWTPLPWEKHIIQAADSQIIYKKGGLERSHLDEVLEQTFGPNHGIVVQEQIDYFEVWPPRALTEADFGKWREDYI